MNLVVLACLGGLPTAGVPRAVLAGMPMITLSDFGRLRFQTLSFFLMLVLASAWGVQKLWNSLAKDFPRMPRLGYRKALTVVVLWGLLFIIVLTMISGARELMTPGAWEKQGYTYKVRAKADPSTAKAAEVAEPEPQSSERQAQLHRLYAALLKHASAHSGALPSDADVKDSKDETWKVPGIFGMQYVYIPGRKLDGSDLLLAFEPEVFGKTRFVLLANGDVRPSNSDQILRSLAAEKRP